MNRRTFLSLPLISLLARAFPATWFSLDSNGNDSFALQVPNREINPLQLWYRQPATAWNEALPIGNGRLAAMVFGVVESERIQINEETIWAGEKLDRNNPEGARALPEVRRLLFPRKPRGGENPAAKNEDAAPPPL